MGAYDAVPNRAKNVRRHSHDWYGVGGDERSPIYDECLFPGCSAERHNELKDNGKVTSKVYLQGKK